VDVAESWQRGNNPVFVFGSLLAQRQFTAADFAPFSRWMRSITLMPRTTSARRSPLSSRCSIAPVRGGPWVAIRGPSNASGHRLSFVTIEGRARVPQRFAVDWTLLGEDGRPFRGDRTDVTNWYGYDAPVYSAAAGTVVLVRDGNPDRAAFGEAPPAVLDAAIAPGNVVVIDIGHGQFATYAHLKSGSLRVSPGDRVAEGQLLARIGNSGNTLGPHLHFHVSDAAEPLGGEGLPFTLQSFELIGRIRSLTELLGGNAWRSNAQPAPTVTAEMPLENMVVRFKN
jgi:murein DD-endopeptidase